MAVLRRLVVGLSLVAVSQGEVAPLVKKKPLVTVGVDEGGGTAEESPSSEGREEESTGEETVEELFQKALEKESVKDTMKALMALDASAADGVVDRVELAEILRTLFPSRNNYLARVDDYVRPGSRLPYVFDAITPEALSIEWSDSDVATIFARFDEDSDGRIEQSEVVVSPGDSGVLSTFANYFLATASTPYSDTRRMWAVLKNLTCACSETDEAENFVHTDYAPCLVDDALRALESLAPAGYCRLAADPSPHVLTAHDFETAAEPLFRHKRLSADLSFATFRRFVLEEPAEITHAISHLVYVGAHAAARALLLQQLMLASSDLFDDHRDADDDDDAFEINDARYRKMLHDRRRTELVDLALKLALVAAALAAIAFFLNALARARRRTKTQAVAIAYLAGLAGLPAPPRLDQARLDHHPRLDLHHHDDDDDDPDLPAVLANAFQAGQTDASQRHRPDLDKLADHALLALHHELHNPFGASHPRSIRPAKPSL